jgi:serine/threonine-protein kinase
MATTDTLLNRVFDSRYLIRRKLGAGGMADVYLAVDQELGRRVAIKMLNERHANDDQFVERFRREAQSAAGLNHANIVSIFDRGHAEGTYYIAMEYLDGRTLKELLIRNGPTPVPIAIDYARQILAALAFAHRHGIVHRDIKPHNIVVGKDGRLKVTDFGIARSGASQMTEAGSIVGTAQYLSPEQARGSHVDPRSDLYSLGIVIYEMLTGRVPFTGDAPVEIAMKHLSAVPEPPSKLRPEVHDLDPVVMRALAKEPDQRYGSAEEMDADLARVARGVAVAPETETAMTQVLAGAGVAAAPTTIARPSVAVTPPPAPPAYRPPGPYYDYEERARRSIWPWLLGLLAAGILAATAWFAYEKIQDQLNANKPVAVTDVGSLQQKQAVKKLEEQGLAVKVETEPSETVPAGAVVEQVPGPNDKVAKGSTVTIYVSTGKPKVSVPSVTGMTVELATSTLKNAGLDSNPVEINSGKDAGTVTAQSPAGGTTVVKGTTVRINVSKGPQLVQVPNVVGQLYLNARGALQGAGFAVVRSDVDSLEPKGQVIAQDPGAGASTEKGALITLSVSKGPAIKQVPDVTAMNRPDAQGLLRQAGYNVVVVYQDVTDPASDGIVIAEDPRGGSNAPVNTLVTLTVGRLVNTGVEVVPPATTTTSTTPTTTTTVSETPATPAAPDGAQGSATPAGPASSEIPPTTTTTNPATTTTTTTPTTTTTTTTVPPETTTVTTPAVPPEAPPQP